MTPLEFTLENANEIIPDGRRRVLTGEARKWAEAGLRPRTRFKRGETYWDGVVKEHERILWLDAYKKRVNRLKRLAIKEPETWPQQRPTKR